MSSHGPKKIIRSGEKYAFGGRRPPKRYLNPVPQIYFCGLETRTPKKPTVNDLNIISVYPLSLNYVFTWALDIFTHAGEGSLHLEHDLYFYLATHSRPYNYFLFSILTQKIFFPFPHHLRYIIFHVKIFDDPRRT